jgi:hypothetical protein
MILILKSLYLPRDERVPSGEASAGGVIRDERWSWLSGFSLNIGVCIVLEQNYRVV